jgi:hypothetical protein
MMSVRPAFQVSGEAAESLRLTVAKARPAAARPHDALAWFRDLTGVEYPVPAALAGLSAVKPNLWASYVVPHSRAVGLPHFLSVEPVPDPPVLRVIGHVGQGLNSHALYSTIIDANRDIRLRLAFGGAFMDMEERRQAILADLTLIEWLYERVRDLPVRCVVRFGKGDREVRLTTAGPTPRKLYECFHSRPAFPHDEVRAAVERALS